MPRRSPGSLSLFFGYFAVKLLGWGAARDTRSCGADVLEVGARPVVMIRVPTLTDQHRQDHARVLIVACRLHSPPPASRDGTGSRVPAGVAGGPPDGSAEAAGEAASVGCFPGLGGVEVVPADTALGCVVLGFPQM